MNLLRCGLLLATLVVACGGDAPSGPVDAAIDAPSDSPADAPSGDGGLCCTPSAAPACCMGYGGYATNSAACAQVCDGMPQPGDPQWKLVKDSHGCDVWTNPRGTFVSDGCGSAKPPDAGPGDAGAGDASSD